MLAGSRRALLLAAAAPLLAATPACAKTPLAAVPISRLALTWWRERHAAKLAEIKRSRANLVFLGDSITQDYEQAGPPAWRDFRPVWQHFYGDRNAVNLGFSGDATSHLLWRIENGEIDGISPDVAIILIGANNLGRLHWPTDENVQGIEAVVAETHRRLPHAKILLLGILPSERSDWASRTTLEVNRALAAKYGNGAVAGVTYLDIASAFMRGGALDRSLFLDPLLQPPEAPLHPTAEGQARMAAAIEPTLARLLGDRNHAGP
jgi:lysophospholipase L1-like esterase